MSFLKAEWRKLAIANFEVEQEVLTNYLPFGTEIDLWNGKCYLSIVGFMFVNTKLLGIKVPFHSNFEEVNLRFYVKRHCESGWKSGVVFIKEIVPKPALSIVANTVYKENYETMPMDHSWIEQDNQIKVTYRWKKGNKWNHFQVVASDNQMPITAKSDTEFITEHYWGYARVSNVKSHEYEVTHPRWNTYDVKDYSINIDFGAVYGDSFSFLNNLTPASVMLAEGSEITVEKKNIICEPSQ